MSFLPIEGHVVVAGGRGEGGVRRLVAIYIYIYIYIYVYICIYIYIYICICAVPGQSARERSAGATLAGRAPTTTEGGGGGAAFCPGGRGARVAEGGTTCPCDPCSLPRRGGRAHAPVRDGSGMGGLVGGTTCPGTSGARLPLLLLLPRDRGGGVLPVGRWRRVGGGGMYGLYPCVPVPLRVVSAGCAMGCCRRQRGPCGPWECSRARGGCAARGGGAPYGLGPERASSASGLGNGRSDRFGRGGCPRSGYSACDPLSRARAGAEGRCWDPTGPVQAMRCGWRCVGTLGGFGCSGGVGRGAALRRPQGVSACQLRGRGRTAQGEARR